jgi:hypothetical protein
MLGHRVDKLNRNPVALALTTDDETLFLCGPIPFMIGPVSSEACHAQEPVPCASSSNCLAMPIGLFYTLYCVLFFLKSVSAPVSTGNVHGIKEH